MFLDSECRDDQELRRELDALLLRTAAAENFLNESGMAFAAQLMGQAPSTRSARSGQAELAAIPAQIGRYRVTGKLEALEHLPDAARRQASRRRPRAARCRRWRSRGTEERPRRAERRSFRGPQGSGSILPAGSSFFAFCHACRNSS